MDPSLVWKLQNSKVTQLSTEDQQTAIKYISCIVFLETNLQSPSSFLTLPHRVSVFPRLVGLDHLFGYRSREHVEYIVRAAQDRQKAPFHFTDALASFGVPTGRLDMGIMICPDTTWDYHEALLKRHVYPMLNFAANMKAKRNANNVT
jgi:hypothetical protein